MLHLLLECGLFLFLSLGILKRYSELYLIINSGKSNPKGRGYIINDMPALFTLGYVSGALSCLILGLYIDQSKTHLYSHIQLLWGFVVLNIFWITHLWFQAHRGNVHDDPVKFILTDRITLWLLCIGIVLFLLAQ